MQQYQAVVLFALCTLVACLLFPQFATLHNFSNIIRQSAVPIIGCMAIGFVLATGNIDLSAGYVVGLTSMAIGVMIEAGLPIPLVILLAIGIGVAFGFLNGALIVFLDVPSFITTLGSGFIAYGLAQMLSGSRSIRQLPQAFLSFGRFEVLGLPIMVFYALGIVVLSQYLVKKTLFGRTLTSMGLNEHAAYMSGLRTKKTMLLSFVLCTTLVAFTAIMSTIRVNTAQADMGGGNYTFEAVTACVLGGTSLSGGKVNAIGGFFSVLIIKELEVCLTIMGVNRFFFQAFLGIIILCAIIVDALRNQER